MLFHFVSLCVHACMYVYFVLFTFSYPTHNDTITNIVTQKIMYSIKHIHNFLTYKKRHTLTYIILHPYKYIHIHTYICLFVHIYIYICTYLYSKLPILSLTIYVKPNNSMSRRTPPANFTPNEPINLQTKPKHKRD